MISAMQQPWSVVIEQLAELDSRQDFDALGQALLQLRLQRFDGWFVPCEEATATQVELLENLWLDTATSE